MSEQILCCSSPFCLSLCCVFVVHGILLFDKNFLKLLLIKLMLYLNGQQVNYGFIGRQQKTGH